MGDAQRGSLASASRATLESIAMSDNPITSPDAPEAVKRYVDVELSDRLGRPVVRVDASDFDRVVAERNLLRAERDRLLPFEVAYGEIASTLAQSKEALTEAAQDFSARAKAIQSPTGWFAQTAAKLRALAAMGDKP
jgi:chemotaxis protein histidine kinase CheA